MSEKYFWGKSRLRSRVSATDGVGAGEFRRQRVVYNLKINILPVDHREETVSGDDGESVPGGGQTLSESSAVPPRSTHSANHT
jgi:hypothetical protein